MAKPKYLSRKWRTRKAYGVTFRVTMSYFWLWLKSKVLGKAYFNRKVLALHLKNAQRIKFAILELRGLFIKVGQALSVLTNILPEALQEPLEELQDNIPPRPYSEIRQRIEQELGQKPEELFDYFNPTSIAAASIGQVHRARLKNGAQVVVKVQHMGIENVAEIDLEILKRIAAFVGFFIKMKGLNYFYTQIRKMVEEELDFEKEAASMHLIQKNIIDEAAVIIPEVFKAYSSTRVLTTRFCEGVKMANLQQIKDWGLDLQQLAKNLLEVYSKMVVRDGFYHADPHPGNILVQKSGKIVLLDFGAVATLDANVRQEIPRLIECLIKNNQDGIVTIIRKLGIIADGKTAERIADKLVRAFGNFLHYDLQMRSFNIKDMEIDFSQTSLFKLRNELNFKELAHTVQVPKDFVLLNRMTTLLLGLVNKLAPAINPLLEVQPYLKELALGKRSNWQNLLLRNAKSFGSAALTIPEDLQKTLQKVSRDKLEIRVASLRESALLFHNLGQQIVYVLLIMTATVIGILFRQSNNHHYSNISFGVVVFFLFLLLRAIRSGARLKRKL